MSNIYAVIVVVIVVATTTEWIGFFFDEFGGSDF
jgi:hypothetical protein